MTAAVLSKRVNDVSREFIDRLPAFRFVVENEKAAVSSAEQCAARCLIQRADEIAFWIVADSLNPRSVRIVATDASIRAEPNHLFAIDEDGIHMVGTQPA